jgi:hypothetical protein
MWEPRRLATLWASTRLDSTLIVKTEAIRYSETSVGFYRTIRRRIRNVKMTDDCKTATNHVRLGLHV